MITLALLTCAFAAGAPSGAVEIVFLPDDPKAPAFVAVVDGSAQGRALAWALAGTGSSGGELADKEPAGSSLVWPRAPRGASLTERGAGLVLVVDDAGAWQDALATLPVAKGPAPVVVGDRALRLDVTDLADGAPAVLAGSRVRLTGRTVIARKVSNGPVAVLAIGKEIVRAAPAVLASAPGAGACARALPLHASDPDALLRLSRTGEPSCTPRLAIVPVTGVRTDPRKDTPATGLLVVRQ